MVNSASAHGFTQATTRDHTGGGHAPDDPKAELEANLLGNAAALAGEIAHAAQSNELDDSRLKEFQQRAEFLFKFAAHSGVELKGYQNATDLVQQASQPKAKAAESDLDPQEVDIALGIIKNRRADKEMDQKKKAEQSLQPDNSPSLMEDPVGWLMNWLEKIGERGMGEFKEKVEERGEHQAMMQMARENPAFAAAMLIDQEQQYTINREVEKSEPLGISGGGKMMHDLGSVYE